MQREKREASDWLTSAALERQRLGLSKAEYDALTPFEISCELAARRILDESDRLKLEVLDEHFARVELLLNGYHFPEMKGLEDFRLLKHAKTGEPTKKIDGKMNVAFALKRAKEIREFVNKRNEIREKRKQATG